MPKEKKSRTIGAPNTTPEKEEDAEIVIPTAPAPPAAPFTQLGTTDQAYQVLFGANFQPTMEALLNEKATDLTKPLWQKLFAFPAWRLFTTALEIATTSPGTLQHGRSQEQAQRALTQALQELNPVERLLVLLDLHQLSSGIANALPQLSLEINTCCSSTSWIDAIHFSARYTDPFASRYTNFFHQLAIWSDKMDSRPGSPFAHLDLQNPSSFLLALVTPRIQQAIPDKSFSAFYNHPLIARWCVDLLIRDYRNFELSNPTAAEKHEERKKILGFIQASPALQQEVLARTESTSRDTNILLIIGATLKETQTVKSAMPIRTRRKVARPAPQATVPHPAVETPPTTSPAKDQSPLKPVITGPGVALSSKRRLTGWQRFKEIMGWGKKKESFLETEVEPPIEQKKKEPAEGSTELRVRSVTRLVTDSVPSETPDSSMKQPRAATKF